MSLEHAGNAQPSIDREEHWHANGDENLPGVKRSVLIDPVTGNPAVYTDGKIDVNSTAILAELRLKTEPTDAQMTELEPVIRHLLEVIASPGWYDRSSAALRIVAQSGTITTITTVTNLTNIGSFSGDHLQKAVNNAAWQTIVGSRFT